MKQKQLKFGHGFSVMLGNKAAQAAQMTLAPGETEGGRDNSHRGADQWLFVVSGQGEAIVNRKKHLLRAGMLLLIERGDLHEIRNTSGRPLQTLNLYVPPAFSNEGNELPRGRKA